MTPKQALDLLIEATGLLKLTRAEHQNVSRAIMVLNGLIEEDIKKPKDETKKK